MRIIDWGTIGHVNIGIILLCIRNSNDTCTYKTLSQNVIGRSTPNHEFLKLIGWFCEIMRRQFYKLTCPIVTHPISGWLLQSCHLKSLIPAVVCFNHDKGGGERLSLMASSFSTMASDLMIATCLPPTVWTGSTSDITKHPDSSNQFCYLHNILIC